MSVVFFCFCFFCFVCLYVCQQLERKRIFSCNSKTALHSLLVFGTLTHRSKAAQLAKHWGQRSRSRSRRSRNTQNLKTAISSPFLELERPDFACGYLRLMPIIWHHVRYANYHRGVLPIMQNLVPVSFRDLGNISWTIQGNCLISCVLTYYHKATWFAKGEGQRSRSYVVPISYFLFSAIFPTLFKLQSKHLEYRLTGVSWPSWQNIEVKGQGQGHEDHKTVKTLKLQYLPCLF